MKRAALLFFLSLGVTPMLQASTFFEVTKTCPVGGEKFKHSELGSITTFGSYPDGMPYGSGYFPVALAECPKNGLVIFRDFEKPEIKRLEVLLTSPEYKILRQQEGDYYRAYWLERQLAPTSPEAVWLLLSVAWDAKNQEPNGARAKRYMTEFVDVVLALPQEPATLRTIMHRLRATHMLREMERFDEAAVMLRPLTVADVMMDTTEIDADESAEFVEWFDQFKEQSLKTIERRDATRFPIDLQPREQAAWRCIEKDYPEDLPQREALTPFETTYCAAPEQKAAIDEARKRLTET